MPKEVIDYSNTIIYKIVCNDINITDTYVGHTTNFVQRKHAHKQSVNNPKSHNYNCKLYKFVRAHGGWNNWSMIIVAFKNCANNYEACAFEHEYYKLLNANLNSIDPYKPKEIIEKKEDIIDYKYNCDECDFKNNNKYIYNKHKKAHNKDNYMTTAKNYVNFSNKFECTHCYYSASRKSQFERHIMTAKHLKNINTTTMELNTTIKSSYTCQCGKNYNHRASLFNHKKICNLKKENINCEIIEQNNQENIVKELKEIILKQQSQIEKQQDQISELIPKVGNNNTINNTINNTNNNNQKFNINVFLNEQCKDAMSLNEFVKSIEITLKNLLTTKSKGLTIGLNEIINENMNKLSLYERPIHCTDKKRETLYVKNDKWEKDIDKTNTTSMLKDLQLQQIKNLHKFKEDNPNYEQDEELKHEYMILLNKCTKPLSESEKKLFKNLCDNTYIKDDEILIK